MDYYTFIIDTTAYSGNFERQMTAFMTGVVGDCGMGADYAFMYECGNHDINFENLLYQKVDPEHDIYRPCEIETTPGYVNDGYGKHMLEGSDEANAIENMPNRRLWPAYQSVAIFFREDPTIHKDFLKDRAHKFVEYYNKHGSFDGIEPSEKIEIIGFRVRKTETTSITYEI